MIDPFSMISFKSLIDPILHVERDSQSLAKYSWEIVNIKTKIIELKNVKKVNFVQRDEKISRFQPDCRQEDHKGQSNVTFSYVILMEVSKIWYVKDLLSLSNPSCKNVKFFPQSLALHISILLLNHFYIRLLLYSLYCNLNGTKNFLRNWLENVMFLTNF